jgi:HlyD family secretion protein
VKRTLFLLLLLALATFLYLASGAQESRISYRTAPIERGRLVTTTTSTGTIEAVVTVEVGSQLSGQVAELFVDFNDEVKKGQAIAQLDQQSFKAEVREASAALAIAQAGVRMQEAAVKRARSNLARAETKRKVLQARTENARIALEKAERDLARADGLRRKGAVAVSVLEDAQTERDKIAVDHRSAEAEQAVHEQEIAIARADLLEAEAALANARGVVSQKQAVLEQAEVRLERTVIRSPIDGVVIGRNIDRGQTVAASLEAPTLFTIAQDLRQMEVHAKIDEADIGRIRVGQRAIFTVDSYPRRTFSGEVTQIRKAPQAVKNVVVYTVLIATENPDLALLPGMTAVARIVIDEVSDVLKVPNAALRYKPPDEVAEAAPARDDDTALKGIPATVWVKRVDGSVAPVRIGTGAADATATELVSGPLTEGEAVVVGHRSTGGGRTLFGLRLGF